ncbi:hypothetical protein [uncultured Shewanella sp.]|uniref:hypothetical protein n=1 Tax=uncultured Shewanella sp. TaxID=173975 RepID=UPI00345DF17B
MIEFELAKNIEAVKVSYSKKPEVLELTSEKAIQILKYKDKSWKYEKEYRCIVSDVYVPISVTKLILGPRVPESTRELLEGILRCCKPNLKVVHHKGLGDSVIESPRATVSSKKVYYRPSDACSKCLEIEHYRNELVANK